MQLTDQGLQEMESIDSLMSDAELRGLLTTGPITSAVRLPSPSRFPLLIRRLLTLV